jgi:hypothetical protein
MTVAISSVSSSSVASTNNNSSSTALSDDTKNKLQALGLDPSKYTTEAQAQAAITQAQAQQQSQQSGTQKSGSSSFSTIKTEVQDLASKMGISVGSNDKMKDILGKISDKMSELQSTAGTDPTKLSELNGYQSQYTSISSELSQLEASRNMTGATALADYNKATLVKTAA